jgi:putative ABC transport system permease protein
MFKTLEIIWNSFKMVLQELRVNKLRTFLSLFGVTIGIFCIIGVLSTVNSLEQNIQNEIKDLGSNTIYLDKWDYGGGPDYPWWKYVKRPAPKYEEVNAIRERTPSTSYIAFNTNTSDNVEFEDEKLQNVNYYGISTEFQYVQPVDISFGRYLSNSEFDQGSPNIIMGFDNAENLFGSAEKAVGKQVKLRSGIKATIVGVIKKKGQGMLGGWNYDQCIMMSFRFLEQMIEEKFANPVILIQGKENITTKQLKDELRGSMRAIRRLGPTQEDDFTLNDINDFSAEVSGLFSSVNVGGWVIAILSLVVGLFGVANIMFVTVRERTSQIGLKKAIGAKKSIILMEFLLESAFLCIIGGAIGLMLVFLLTKGISTALDFPIYISTGNLIMAIVICLIVGIGAGIIPASIAAKMDPVVAIRSK